MSFSKLFVLDSLYSDLPHTVLDDLKTFLYYEAKMRWNKKLDKDRFDSFLVSVSQVFPHRNTQWQCWQVPQQPNAIDCGVYAMHFMKVFVQSPALLVEHMEVNLFRSLTCISWHISYSLELPKNDGWAVSTLAWRRDRRFEIGDQKKGCWRRSDKIRKAS